MLKKININVILNYFSLRRDRFTKPSQDTNKKNANPKTASDKSNLYKPPSQNLSSSLSRVDCGRYSLRTSRAPQPNSVCVINNYTVFTFKYNYNNFNNILNHCSLHYYRLVKIYPQQKNGTLVYFATKYKFQIRKQN